MSNAIPTKYNGIQFRSRLEAKWAAMFDRLEWKWEYEPIDLKGYIPDFMLIWHRPLLVEVKPIIDWKDGEYASAARKIKNSGWKYEAVVVGATLFESKEFDDATALGEFALGETCGEPGTTACLLDCSCGVGLFDGALSYHCRRCGSSEHGGHPRPASADELQGHWHEAGNAVQWRGVDARPFRKPDQAREVKAKPSEPLPHEEVQSFFGNLASLLDDY